MASGQEVLVVDLGSSWCKAALIDATGRVNGTGEEWVREERIFGHDAAALERIWRAVRLSIARALASRSGDPPAAIAIATRKAPGIWLDGAGEPIGLEPEVAARVGREEIDACYASHFWRDEDPFAYGYGIDLIGNTRWLWRNRPHEWSRIHRAGTLQSWLLDRLTGRWATSHAGGPVQDHWPDIVWELSGLHAAAYPEVVEDTATIGPLLDEAARELGLPAGTPVITGTHDGAAASIGAGAIEPGDACLTLGTNGVLRVVNGPRLPRRFGYTITGGRWALVRDLPNLSRLLDRVVSAIDGRDEPVPPARHEELAAQAATVPVGAEGLRLRLFPDSSGVSAEEALERGFPATTIYRAALEAVGLGFAGLVKQARLSGAEPRRFVATGGGSHNETLMEIISACIGAPITTTRGPSGATGVAALAHTAIGNYPGIAAAVERMVAVRETFDALIEMREAYAGMVSPTRLPAGVAPGDRVAGIRDSA